MSATSYHGEGFWDWPETRAVLLPVAAVVSGVIVGNNLHLLEILATRAAEIAVGVALAPGIDITQIAAALLTAIGVPPAGALFLSSLAALPVLAILVLSTTAAGERRLLRCLLIGTHPVVLALGIAGAGWAAPALYLLWYSLASLPRHLPQQGMIIVGLAMAFAFVSVPGFYLVLPPLAATLFLCAPPQAMRRHAIPFYLAAFAPVLMLFGALAYVAWTNDAEWPGKAILPGDSPPAILAAIAAMICGPGLLSLGMMKGSGPRFAALISTVFAAAWGANILLVCAMAAIAQSALAAPRGESASLSYLSFAGGAAVVIGLSLFQTG